MVFTIFLVALYSIRRFFMFLIAPFSCDLPASARLARGLYASRPHHFPFEESLYSPVCEVASFVEF